MTATCVAAAVAGLGAAPLDYELVEGAGQYKWIGSSGGDWASGANWSGNTVPTTGDYVVYDGAGACTIMPTDGGNTKARGIIVSEGAGKLTIDPYNSATSPNGWWVSALQLSKSADLRNPSILNLSDNPIVFFLPVTISSGTGYASICPGVTFKDRTVKSDDIVYFRAGDTSRSDTMNTTLFSGAFESTSGNSARQGAVIEANHIVRSQGQFNAKNGTVCVSGRLILDGGSLTAGSIEIIDGDSIEVASSSVISNAFATFTGTILLTPTFKMVESAGKAYVTNNLALRIPKSDLASAPDPSRFALGECSGLTFKEGVDPADVYHIEIDAESDGDYYVIQPVVDSLDNLVKLPYPDWAFVRSLDEEEPYIDSTNAHRYNAYDANLGGYWWTNKHESVLAQIASEPNQKFDLVLVGDSITHRWDREGHGAAAYATVTNQLKTLNLGFGADGSVNCLWRLRNGELDGYTAKVFQVLIGTNDGDVSWVVAARIRAVLREIRSRHPESTIMLCALLPRGELDDERRLRNAAANEILRPLCNDDWLVWADWSRLFIHSDWTMNRTYAWDMLHPTVDGFARWRDAALPIWLRAAGKAEGAVTASAILGSVDAVVADAATWSVNKTNWGAPWNPPDWTQVEWTTGTGAVQNAFYRLDGGGSRIRMNSPGDAVVVFPGESLWCMNGSADTPAFLALKGRMNTLYGLRLGSRGGVSFQTFNNNQAGGQTLDGAILVDADEETPAVIMGGNKYPNVLTSSLRGTGAVVFRPHTRADDDSQSFYVTLAGDSRDFAGLMTLANNGSMSNRTVMSIGDAAALGGCIGLVISNSAMVVTGDAAVSCPVKFSGEVEIRVEAGATATFPRIAADLGVAFRKTGPGTLDLGGQTIRVGSREIEGRLTNGRILAPGDKMPFAVLFASTFPVRGMTRGGRIR